jgi:two-component system, chemotaxis family, chemotaxis protein CheY
MVRVLLVENDGICRAEIAEVLGELGFEVDQAGNGAEALALLDSSPRAPDAILLDLITPVLDGWGFCRARSANPRHAGIPLVVMSGISDLESQARSLGAAARLRKPFELKALLDALRVACPVESAT